jgi:hypothetical protein
MTSSFAEAINGATIGTLSRIDIFSNRVFTSFITEIMRYESSCGTVFE